MNGPVWKHPPTLVGLVVFCALLLLTGIVLTNRLVFPSGRFESLASPSTPEAPEETKQLSVPTVSISGVGDIVLGAAPGSLPPNNGEGLFDDVREALAADVVTGNLETAITEDTGHDKCAEAEPTPSPTPTESSLAARLEESPSRQMLSEGACYAFRVPPTYAASLSEGGFHVLSLANNHARDFGYEGRRNTQVALEQAGIQVTGLPGQYAVRQSGAISVAVVGFGPYGSMPRVTDLQAARDLVGKADAEADLVVVHMQAGAEGKDKQHVKPGVEEHLGENRGDVMAFSRAVIDAGADLVVGHGPHVLRGMEWYKDRLIAYSVGNFAGYGTLSASGVSGIGGILNVSLSQEGSFVSGTLTSTRLGPRGVPELDSGRRAVTMVRQLSAEDFGNNGVELADDGAILAR